MSSAADDLEAGQDHAVPAGAAHHPAANRGPTLSLPEAAKRTGASRSTLQRRLKAGAIDGATRGPDGAWRIPYVGLIAAGFQVGAPPAPPPAAVTLTDAARAELDMRREALEHEMRRESEVTLWRTLAEERARTIDSQARTIDTLSRTLDTMRALTMGTAETPTQPGTDTPPAAVTAPPMQPRRRWRWRTR